MSDFRVVPGAHIPPSQVIGRDGLIAQLWERLERQSLLLTAERRIGKTSVIKKMAAEAPAGKLVYYRDLEGVQTAGEFAQIVFEDVEKELSKTQKIATVARQLVTQLSGAEFSVAKLPQIAELHWKKLLDSTIRDLVEHTGQQIIFFWDEFPWMLENIKNNVPPGQSGDRAAMEVLDTLRAMRNTYPSLRIVLTGSIGLHHVISTLKAGGYNNAPTNDLYLCEVPPLADASARQLARALLEGEKISVDDEEQVAASITEEVDGVAFYIHHVVDVLKSSRQQGIATTDKVKSLVEDALYDDQDRWHLRHYRDRLFSYYGDRVPLALVILDTVADAEAPLPLRDLLSRVQSQTTQASDEEIRDLLDLLRRDHYLSLSGAGYDFRFSLIKRWWQAYRGLNS